MTHPPTWPHYIDDPTYAEEYDRLRQMDYPPYEAALLANANTREREGEDD